MKESENIKQRMSALMDTIIGLENSYAEMEMEYRRAKRLENSHVQQS